MKTIFTTGQVAKICKVAPRTVSKWFDSGRLKGYRIPGSQDRRIPRAHLIEFLKKHGMPYDELEDDTPVILCVSMDIEKFAHAFDDNFSVFHAQTCFEATMKFQACHARCVVVDFRTLRNEASQFCKSLKALPEGMPFVIGIGDPHNAHEACDKFLQDPFDPVMLCADMQRLFGIGVPE